MKSHGKTKIFQGQGKVSEFCIWSGKFGIPLKVSLDIIRLSFTFIEHLNKNTEKYVKHVMFFEQIAMFKVSEILL